MTYLSERNPFQQHFRFHGTTDHLSKEVSFKGTNLLPMDLIRSFMRFSITKVTQMFSS